MLFLAAITNKLHAKNLFIIGTHKLNDIIILNIIKVAKDKVIAKIFLK